MTKTRLVLIAIASTLIILASACGAALDSGGKDSSGPPRDAGQNDTTFGVFNGDAEATAAEYDGEGVGSRNGSFDTVAGGDPLAPPTDAQLQGLLDRKIIQSTSVDIEVEEVGGSFQEIIRVAETAGGFVASSSFSNRDDEQIADATIRVPGDQYQAVLASIRGMGTVTTESSDANDVTEEYTDLQARLRTLNATEQRYLELLGQADQINEILLVQDRLDVVRGQIEQVLGRINLLEHLTDLATITVHLRPETLIVEAAVDGGSNLNPLEAASASWEASLTALRGVASVALIIVVFSWWLVPPAALLALGARWLFSRRPRHVINAPSA